jgi:hypothetical protein
LAAGSKAPAVVSSKIMKMKVSLFGIIIIDFGSSCKTRLKKWKQFKSKRMIKLSPLKIRNKTKTLEGSCN